MQIRRPTHRAAVLAAVLAAAASLAACDSILEVENPGPIQDEALNTPAAIDPLVVGMSFDLSDALAGSGTSGIVLVTALLSGELAHSGSYPLPGLFYRGIVNPEDVTTVWAAPQQARWVAESGIERIRGILTADQFGRSLPVAKAHVYAGLANRTLGENMCYAVISLGAQRGTRQERGEHFKRAETQFSEAIRIAQAGSGTEKDSILRVAYGGRAAVRAWQGKWAEAVQDARQVPTSFVWVAKYSAASDNTYNDLVYETYDRLEYTVHLTEFATVRGDPRVPWDTARTRTGGRATGPNGTLALQQRKYQDKGADIPLVKGTEMRLLEAEAALRGGNVADALRPINEARAFYRMPAAAAPATLADAWRLLQFERGATLWLEGRRFWDVTRWARETGPAQRSYPSDRPTCIPISKDEIDSNPNLRS